MTNSTDTKIEHEPDAENNSENMTENVIEEKNNSGKNISTRSKLLAAVAGGAILIVLLVAVFYLFSGKQVKAAPAPGEVEVVEVEQKDVPIYSEWIGSTDGMVNAEIRAQVSGYLLRQNYIEGSFVTKGQLLFEIDPRPFQAALDQAKGKLAEAQGKLGQSESQLIQTQAQVSQTQAQVEQAQAQVAQRQALTAQAQAQYSQAEANQRRTQLDVNKYKPLREQRAVTQQELDNAIENNGGALAQIRSAKAQIDVANAQISDAKAAVSTAQAQVRAATAQTGTAKAAITSAKAAIDSAEAEVRAAEIDLGMTKIYSPIDGIAGIALAQVGNLLGPTGTALTTVSTVDPIKVYFAISEQEYLHTSERSVNGSGARETLRGLELELILADGSKYPEAGKFFLADRQVDEKTGTIRLAGIFPNPHNTLRPGQYGQVRAITSVKENAMLVPQRAITDLQGVFQVAVVGDDNKIAIRNVKIGETIEGKRVIEEGLKPGEKVVVGGVQKVAPGVEVVPKPYAPPAGEVK
jgi:membrane fusion protein (multidrug efflux system)